MVTEQWLLGLVVAAVVANVVFAYRAYRLRQRGYAAVNGDASVGVTVDEESGVVECPDCGAENEYGYRYCRDCVSELPVGTTVHRSGDGRPGRLLG